MLAWHVPFLGWRRMPADLSEFEIAHFFTLKPIEIRAVRSRYKESLRLGAALQLGFLKMSGRPLSAFQRVPTDLLQHLGEQLAVSAPDIATLRAIYLRRRSTLFEHQAWAISYLGMRRIQASDAATLIAPLTDVVRSGVFGDHLLASTRRILYEHHVVIPGRRRLADVSSFSARPNRQARNRWCGNAQNTCFVGFSRISGTQNGASSICPKSAAFSLIFFLKVS